MPVSITISLDELEKLRSLVLAAPLKRAELRSEHELLRIADGEISIVVYRSGRLVHNNTEASRKVVGSILEREREYDFLLGSDEVGKGEWYGPLIVTCVALRPEDIVRLRKIGVRDSKLLGKSELDKLAQEIVNSKIIYRDVTLTPETYNKMYDDFRREGKTLNDLLAWSHATAIKSVLAYIRSKRTKVVIDKFDFKKTDLRLERAHIKDEDMEIIQSSKGDTEIPVMAASIVAKSLFETRVDELNSKFNVNLRNSKPTELDPEILGKVAKLHFKNVKEAEQKAHC